MSSYITFVKDTQLKRIFMFYSCSELYMDNIPYDALLLKLHMDH